MKKQLLLILVVLTIFIFSACQSNPEMTAEENNNIDNQNNKKCSVGLYLSSSGKRIAVYNSNKVKGDDEVIISVVVKFDSFEIHKFGGSDAGWHKIDTPDSSVDLMAIASLVELFLIEIPDGTYNKLRLKISEAEVTLESGEVQQAICPSGKIDFNFNFSVTDGEMAEINCEIDPDKSIVKVNKNKYKITPVIHLINIAVN